ncbi:MAG: tetratricopeptide repeat protein [Burkholderiales bacterium]|nr:tetratricopeptide repeat protein [Burkholderiales bacterium]
MSVEPATENPIPDSNPEAIRTFLFTDIEGSTRLWENEPERMRAAVARHDVLSREAVLAAGGQVVKTTGDGVHAVFADALQAVQAALNLQQAMAAPMPEGGLALKVRCGVHCGESEARDGDFFGPALNRAARVMSAAHGGQTLLTQAVAERLRGRLPSGVTLLDLGVVRLRDLASPERVHQLQHPALRAQFPPLRSLEATPNNLAQQLNSFVGRERELAEVRALLAKTRLLTLLGMGGIGKSRLSVQLGAELLDEYPDGVWLVELAPLADPLLVPQALASVLGVKEEQGSSVTDALLSYVRDKTLLVILDNCEHVVHACADLAKRLLQAAPGVRVLGSSRDVLQVAGETAYQVPTLSVPGDEGAEVEERTVPPAHLARLARHEAVRLFMDRASAVQPALRLTAQNAGAVASICRQLDGIPLALELAAARTRALSVQAIAARLADRFRLLVSGDRTVLPRQRTLRALIDWSFDLLDEAERMLFRRLSVFAGGWTLESAEAVCEGGGIESPHVLDLLARLVEKSLVVMDAGGTRYRMLETVRAYALEKLVEAGDEAATRGRHLEHFLGLAETARPHLAGPVQSLWLKRLDQERENFIAAHDWCGRAEECAMQGLQLVFVLKTYWRIRGLLGLGQRITVEASMREAARPRGFARCRVLCDAGQLTYFMGRYDESRRYLEESHAIAMEIGDRGRMAAVLQPLGTVYVALGERARARATYESAVMLAREVGEPRQLAAALNGLAQLHHADGSLEVAQPLYEQVLAIARDLGDQESIAIAQLNRAMVFISSRRLADAVPVLREVQAIAAAVGSKPVEKSLLEVCAGLCAARGDPRSAAWLFGAAEALGERTGIRRDANDEAYLVPLLAAARGSLGPQAFSECELAGRSAGVDAASAEAQRALAD